jgi:hypothetical protein
MNAEKVWDARYTLGARYLSKNTAIHLLKIPNIFRALACSSSGGLIVYMQPLVSSLSAGDCPVHRLRKNSSILTGTQDSHLQTVTIPEAAYIYNYDVDLLKMIRAMLETCRGF